MRVTAETKYATRERILACAQELFRSRGYERTTTRDIAHAAKIAIGTLFNYFPTKEALVESLVNEALVVAHREFDGESEASSLEEALFGLVARELRRLRPFRKYLAPILETTLSPLASAASQSSGEAARLEHLEIVARLVSRHDRGESLSPVAWQLYWTLYTGALAFWSQDASPKQEDTLALLDQSLQMFVSWLQGENGVGGSKSRTR